MVSGAEVRERWTQAEREIVRRADAVGELADAVAEIYRDIDQRLERGLDNGSGLTTKTRRLCTVKAPTTSRRRICSSAAREVEVPGRSSMTKEDLLERARDAGIEGRSTMSKKELRKALREVGA